VQSWLVHVLSAHRRSSLVSWPLAFAAGFRYVASLFLGVFLFE
jgi:hypothetical protein